MRDVTETFVKRLRARDPAAWYELWEIFGPILRNQLSRWGRGRIGEETVKDLSQETLAALSTAIDQHDPSRGARFSTWLLAIAKYTLGDEIDRRMAKKRGSGVKPVELTLEGGGASPGRSPDETYEQMVFDAKVGAAIRAVERETGFMEFSIYRMRVLEGRTGKDVAVALGVSEPTVSRRLTQVRGRLRTRLEDVVSRFSFTEEEYRELERNGIDPTPNKREDALFDEALAEVFHRLMRRSEENVTRTTREAGSLDRGTAGS